MAPVNSTWGLENRSVAIRVKGLAGDRLHVENRVPCGASNPYLVGAAAIAAGLDGIRNHLGPPPATEGLAYGVEGPTLIPTRLEAALDELEKDTVLRGLLGEELIHLFLAVKRHEVAKATDHARDYSAYCKLIEQARWALERLTTCVYLVHGDGAVERLLDHHRLA